MSEILCRWLNEELRLSRIVEPKTFAKDFANGYLFGEVLHKYNLQSDFSLFMKKDTAVSKLNNFTRLEPTLRALQIYFDTNTAKDLIEEKQGVAGHLLQQLYVSLVKNKKAESSSTMMKIMQPAASTGLLKKEQDIFSERLHQVVKRDAELKLQKISQHYAEKSQQVINRLVDNQSIQQRRTFKVLDEKKKNADKRNQDANIQLPNPPAKNASHLQLKKKQQVLQRKEQQAEMVKAEIARFETQRKKPVSSGFASLPSSSGQPFPLDYHLAVSKKDLEVSGGETKLTLQSNSKYIQEIQQRLEENALSAVEREKRQDRFLMEQYKAHEAQEEARREEQLIQRLIRQTRQEQRLATQLLQLRMQKDVIRENRLFREQQYQQRRERDFQEALDREAALAHQAKLDRAEEIRMQVELCKRMAAEKAERRHTKHRHVCAGILEQILDLTTKIGEYRLVTQNLIPEKLMREWKELLVHGLPLYETIKGPQPKSSTSLDSIENGYTQQEILNNQDYDDYTNFTGEWAWPEEAGEVEPPPLNNDILGHVIQRLRTDLHSPIIKQLSPPFPPFAIKACILSKFSVKATCLAKIAQELDICILSADTSVQEALNAYKEEQLNQMEPNCVDNEQQDEKDNQQLSTPLESDVNNQMEKEKNTKRAIKGAAAEKELRELNTISNELLVEILVEAIRDVPAHSGWILDGFPLDITQAEQLEKTLGGSVDEEIKSKKKRIDLAVDPNPPKPPSPTPVLDLALLLDIPDEQVVTRAFSLMDEETSVDTQQTDNLVYMAQVAQRTTAFQDALPELEEWFGQKQNILVRVEADAINEEFYSKVKSVLQQVMQKRQKDTATEAVVPDTTDPAHFSSATPGLQNKHLAPTNSFSNLKGENIQSVPYISNPQSPTVAHSENTSTSSVTEKDAYEDANIQSESAALISVTCSQVFADEPLLPEISKYICPYWNMVCHSYVNNVRTVMERLRYQRTVFDQHMYTVSETYKHWLQRPELKQELVSQWQKDFNNVPDDMRDDEDNKTELHLRLDGLRERLWDIGDKRKEEDEQERMSLMSDGWLEEQASVVSDLHSLLMQVELDRFQETLYILISYYCSMLGETLPKPPSNMFCIPILKAQEITESNEREEKSPPPVSTVCNETKEDTKMESIPLVRRALSSGKASPTINQKDTELVQPHEKLIHNYEEAITTISNLVAVETQEWMKREPTEKEQEVEKQPPTSANQKKNNKPSKKEKGSKSLPAVNSPLPEETLKKLHDRKVQDKIQSEYVAARQHEERAAKGRIALVKGHGLVMASSLQSRAAECFGSMEKLLQAWYLAEMKSIDELSEVVRHSIEAGTKLPTELVLESCDFYLNADCVVVESPPPSPRPPPLEKPTSSTLTIVQLEALHQKLCKIAPSGLLYGDEFLCFVKDYALIGRGRNSVLEQWTEINEAQWRDIMSSLSDDEGLIDWRQFLLSAALPWPLPSLSQLLELLQRFKALDTSDSSFITEQQYKQTELWFSNDCHLVVSKDPSEPAPYDRLSNLRRFFFQLFADHEASPPKLNYMQMLLYFAADLNPRQGFIRALSVVLGQPLKNSSSPSQLVKSLPSIEESAELTFSDLDGKNKEDILGLSGLSDADPEVSISDLLAAICNKVSKMKDSNDLNQEKLSEHLKQIYRELDYYPEDRVPFSVLSQHPFTQLWMESSKNNQLINIHRVLQTNQGEEKTSSLIMS